MDQYLLEYHKKHFQQAEETLFTKEPLKFLMEYRGDTEFADRLREGTADIESLPVDQYTKDFLHEMSEKPTGPPPAQSELTITQQKIPPEFLYISCLAENI